jgi:hypothetical protein
MNKKIKRTRKLIPCKTCLMYAICINKAKQNTNLECSILYSWRMNYKGSESQFWDSIDNYFPNNTLGDINF